jgi:hypothetical protein
MWSDTNLSASTNLSVLTNELRWLFWFDFASITFGITIKCAISGTKSLPLPTQPYCLICEAAKTNVYFRFCLHCQPNHKIIPLTMQRRRRQAIELAHVQHSWELLQPLRYYHSADGGFQGAPKPVSGNMHWTKDHHQWRHHQRKDLNNRQVQFATNLTAVLLLCPRSELSQLQRVMAAPLPADMPLTASALVAHGSPITSAFFLLQTLVFTT